jgi:hypothetical protein
MVNHSLLQKESDYTEPLEANADVICQSLAKAVNLEKLPPVVLIKLLHGDEKSIVRELAELADGLSQVELKRIFHVLISSEYSYLYAKRLRHLASLLLKMRVITDVEYQTYFEVVAHRHLTLNMSGDFVTRDTGKDEGELAQCYSRAKYGSMKDICQLAGYIVELFSNVLNMPGSEWGNMFELARENDDTVVLLVPGSRNVESAANIIFDIALPAINVMLANKGYPIIVNVKLPRLDPPVENYASLSSEEREQISILQDHVLPDFNFYRNRDVHVIFGDDILITGSTADKVFKDAIMKGAKSFRPIYAVVIDPLIVLENPSIEATLDTVAVKGGLDKVALSIFAQDDFIPVMKSLSLILDKNNIDSLKSFLIDVPRHNILKVYTSAMSNGYFNGSAYASSLTIVREYLISNALITQDGLLHG